MTDKFDAAIEKALNTDAGGSPIEITGNGEIEVIALRQSADPDLSMRLVRASLSLEQHKDKVGLEIEYAIAPNSQEDYDPDADPNITARVFYAFEDGSVVEILTVEDKYYSRIMQGGEINDIFGLVEQAM